MRPLTSPPQYLNKNPRLVASKRMRNCVRVAATDFAISPLHRRGLVDMRKRFRGNAPISITKDLDGSKSSRPAQQLYAGTPAFQTVKGISGEEVQMDPEKTRGL
jgi:hypothetical protein